MGIPFLGFFGFNDDEDKEELADLEIGMDETSSDWSDSADDITPPRDFDF